MCLDYKQSIQTKNYLSTHNYNPIFNIMQLLHGNINSLIQ